MKIMKAKPRLIDQSRKLSQDAAVLAIDPV